MSEHQALQQVVEHALKEGIDAWLTAPTCYFYESDVQALIYGLLRTKAIEIGVWESRGKLYPEWDPTLVAIVGTTPKVNQLEYWTRPDIVVYEPLGEEIREDQPLFDRKLFCAIELKISFPNPPAKSVNFEKMFKYDLEKLELLVGQEKSRYGISLNLIGLPPLRRPFGDERSYLTNVGKDQRIKLVCVLAGDKNPITPSNPFW